MNNNPYYCVHDETKILGFFGEYRWLSNFWSCPVNFLNLTYPNSECAYQAQKVIPSERIYFLGISASESKKLIKKYYDGDTKFMNYSAGEWDKVKYDIMCAIVFDKFYRNLDLRQKLLDTSNRYLQERNNWKDCYFGYDDKWGGENKLGQILMKVREFWKI